MQNENANRVTSTPFYIQPQPGYIICEQFKEQKIGNFQIADTMSSKDSAGVVIAIGKPVTSYDGGVEHVDTCDLKIGDKIIYSNFSSQRYADFQTGQPLFFVKFKEVLGVITNV